MFDEQHTNIIYVVSMDGYDSVNQLCDVNEPFFLICYGYGRKFYTFYHCCCYYNIQQKNIRRQCGIETLIAKKYLHIHIAAMMMTFFLKDKKKIFIPFLVTLYENINFHFIYPKKTCLYSRSHLPFRKFFLFLP